VIGGYTEPRGSGRHFGALHVGVYEENRLRHVTRVGGGFDEAMQERLWTELQPLARKDSPFGDSAPRGRENHWVEPRLVCQVRFTEWTADGGLRHPIFLGLRADKKPEDVVREGDGDTAGAVDSAAREMPAELGGQVRVEGS